MYKNNEKGEEQSDFKLWRRGTGKNDGNMSSFLTWKYSAFIDQTGNATFFCTLWPIVN